MAKRKDLNLEAVSKKAEFSLLCSAFLSLAQDLLEEEREKEKEEKTILKVNDFEKVAP